MDYTHSPLGKPGGSTQRQRSGRRKRAWRGEQRLAYDTLVAKCERCSEPLLDGVQPRNISHVKHRGMGGSWDETQNTLAATRILCISCHDKYPGWDGEKGEAAAATRSV